MNTPRLVAVAGAFIVGIVLAVNSRAVLPAALLLPLSALGLAAGLWGYAEERRWRERPPWLPLAAAVLFALPLGYWRAAGSVGPPPAGSLRAVLEALPDRARIEIQGVLDREPEQRASGEGLLGVRVDRVRAEAEGAWRAVPPGRLLLRVRPPRAADTAGRQALERLLDVRAYGYRIEARLALERPEPPLNPGEFDLQAYLFQNGWLAQGRCGSGEVRVLQTARGGALTELALELKRQFLNTYKATVREPGSRLIAGATLGARRALERVDYRGWDMQQIFRRAGVGHVLAVSGLHVSVVTLLLYGLFRLAGLRPRQFTPVLIFFLVLFAILTGARPSSVRSVIMHAVALIAFSYFRSGLQQATYVGLALSSFLILLFDNPLVLYSPGFLLSYGAVLALVVVAPPLYRWLLRLRGLRLLAWLGAFALLLALYGRYPRAFNDPLVWLGVAGLCAALDRAGRAANERWPRLRGLGLQRLPRVLTLFGAAQVAIQIGMMIPLSAWFFGHFPLAGVLVNPIAIPAIGVLIQLGMVTGLIGLLPAVGPLLALPFGIAASLTADFFYALAWLGAAFVPYPVMPRPTPLWMAGYYLALGLVLSLPRWRTPAQAWLYRACAPGSRGAARLAVLGRVAVAALALAPLWRLPPRPPRLQTITCLAADRYPLLALVSREGRCVTINAGHRFAGGQWLFQGLRSRGATAVDTAILCGPQPDAGNEGLAALSEQCPIGRCYAPFLSEDPAAYLEAVGDAYLAGEARRGAAWAARYPAAYAALQAALRRAGTPLLPLRPGPVESWRDLQVEVRLPPPARAGRFAASAGTALVALRARGFRWWVVTDGTPESLRAALAAETEPCDVLVLPELGARKTYRELLDTAVALTRPRAIVLSGRPSARAEAFDAAAWAAGAGCPVLCTARDGAVTASFGRGGALALRGLASGRSVTLHPRTP